MKRTTSHLQHDLTEHLLALDFQAFQNAITELLTRMGYRGVVPSGRTTWVGRNADGGYDLMAEHPMPGGSRRVIVQVKQFRPEQRIFRRTIDELRGVALRTGAAEAILITTSSFSGSVNVQRYVSAVVAPVRLIDGAELAQLMTEHSVGVRHAKPRTGQTAPTSAHRGTVSETVSARHFAEGEEPSNTPSHDQQNTVCLVQLRIVTCSRKSTRGNTKKTALPRRS
jgi:hypothetical protein